MSRLFFQLLFLFFPLLAYASVDYTVSLQGIEDESLRTLIEKASDLYLMQSSPPSTRSALRRRAEYDLANIIKALHSQALYNARVRFEYNFSNKPAEIIIHVDPSEPYFLTSVEFVPTDSSYTTVLSSITEEDLHISLPHIGTPKAIRQIEKSLINALNERGYPYVKIVDNKVVADQKAKTVASHIVVDTGPQMTFGPIIIEGNNRVLLHYIEKKVRWCPGEIYSPNKIACTLKDLEASRLFSSVEIALPEEAPKDEILPITIKLQEAKYRSIGFGMNYTTQKGPGILANWENRNLYGLGEILNFRSEIWDSEYFGTISLAQPEFPDQTETLVWSGELRREKTPGYIAQYGQISTLLQKQYNPYTMLAYGLTYKHLKDTRELEEEKSTSKETTTEENDTSKKCYLTEKFNIVKLPFIFHWQYLDDTLNPTKGCNIRIEAVPSYQFLGKDFMYATNTLTTSFYFPLSNFLSDLIPSHFERVLACRLVLGSIPGSSMQKIPRSELFDAGTDTLLRGYRYKTVSPTDKSGEPQGGRSMMVYTTELRMRLSQDFGVVLFHDMGNVYETSYPRPDTKCLHSVGFGFRYFTVVAPIRIDMAFPLNYRKETDKSHYQVYFSLGQTF